MFSHVLWGYLIVINSVAHFELVFDFINIDKTYVRYNINLMAQQG